MGTALAPKLDRIAQISINAHDLERAVAFYRDVLGMKLLFQVPKMAFFDCGGIRMMVALPSSPELDHAGSIIYYKVEDIRTMHEALAARGVPFAAAPHVIANLGKVDLWLAEARDTEGNLFALMSEVPRA
jgi:predicted enzyme related to lactoylglutathione lyase